MTILSTSISPELAQLRYVVIRTYLAPGHTCRKAERQSVSHRAPRIWRECERERPLAVRSLAARLCCTCALATTAQGNATDVAQPKQGVRMGPPLALNMRSTSLTVSRGRCCSMARLYIRSNLQSHGISRSAKIGICAAISNRRCMPANGVSGRQGG